MSYIDAMLVLLLFAGGCSCGGGVSRSDVSCYGVDDCGYGGLLRSGAGAAGREGGVGPCTPQTKVKQTAFFSLFRPRECGKCGHQVGLPK